MDGGDPARHLPVPACAAQQNEYRRPCTVGKQHRQREAERRHPVTERRQDHGVEDQNEIEQRQKPMRPVEEAVGNTMDERDRRSEERRGGKGSVSTGSTRWWPEP